MRPLDTIVIHNSDSAFGSALLINTWHLQRGWNGIGYHEVVTNGRAYSDRKYDVQLDGQIENGRDHTLVGAHVRDHNTGSLGVCLIGVESFTVSQFLTLRNRIRSLVIQYKIAWSNVLGHYELDAKKTCPNIDMDVLRGFLQESDELNAFKYLDNLPLTKK